MEVDTEAVTIYTDMSSSPTFQSPQASLPVTISHKSLHHDVHGGVTQVQRHCTLIDYEPALRKYVDCDCTNEVTARRGEGLGSDLLLTDLCPRLFDHYQCT